MVLGVDTVIICAYRIISSTLTWFWWLHLGNRISHSLKKHLEMLMLRLNKLVFTQASVALREASLWRCKKNREDETSNFSSYSDSVKICCLKSYILHTQILRTFTVFWGLVISHWFFQRGRLCVMTLGLEWGFKENWELEGKYPKFCRLGSSPAMLEENRDGAYE